MYKSYMLENKISCLVVTQMPGIQQERCMKCVCCALVSNDNIKQVYDYAIHPNGKGEHTHIDVKRYMSNCETSITSILFLSLCDGKGEEKMTGVERITKKKRFTN